MFTVYTNSFLATLNSRQLIRRRLAGRSGTKKTTQSVSIPLGFYRPNISGDPESSTDCNDLSRMPSSEPALQADVYGSQKHDDGSAGAELASDV